MWHIIISLNLNLSSFFALSELFIPAQKLTFHSVGHGLSSLFESFFLSVLGELTTCDLQTLRGGRRPNSTDWSNQENHAGCWPWSLPACPGLDSQTAMDAKLMYLAADPPYLKCFVPVTPGYRPIMGQYAQYQHPEWNRDFISITVKIYEGSKEEAQFLYITTVPYCCAYRVHSMASESPNTGTLYIIWKSFHYLPLSGRTLV